MNKKRLSTALVRVSLAFVLAAPMISQDEENPYFSLASSETFASGSTPSVEMSGYNVPAVKIRVYRVNDPVQFLRQMQDPHRFGGSYRNPRGKRTFLEMLNDWKRGLRRDIRYNLRQQFTESPRAHLNLKEAPKAKGKATYYAEAPVLNQSQLVLSFLQPLTTRERWATQKINIPVKDKGVFLVEAVSGAMRAYTVLLVSDIVLVTKVGRDHVLYYVADRKSGDPIADAAVTTMARDSDGDTLRTASDGTASLPIGKTPQQDLRSVAVRGGDAAFGDMETWSFNQRDRNLVGVVYTDRPVYRPGDTAHFRAILRYQQSAGYAVPEDRSFAVQIQDRDGKAIYQKDLKTDSHGVVHDAVELAKDAPLGTFYVSVQSGESTASGYFSVQEYKKPEYEVHVTSESRRVLQGQSTKVTVESRYYFGEPVAGANVKYSIYKSRYYFPLWYEPEDSDETQQEGEPNDYGANQETEQHEGQLDADGKLTFDLQTEVTEGKTDTLYRIEAGVTDKAGREISGTGWVIATYGNFLVNVEPERWFVEAGTTESFRVEARDYDDKPIAAPVHVELYRWDWREHKVEEKLGQTDTATGADGTAHAELKMPSAGGDYRIVATAPSGNRIVQSQTFVWVSGQTESWETGGETKSIQIVADRKSYRPGDTAQIMIVTGQDKTPVLVTMESRDVRSHTMLRSQGGTAVFSYKVTKQDEPGVFVSAQFLRDGTVYQNSKRLRVPPEDHKLQVKLSTDKPQYQPGATATYNVDVTTPEGRPAAETELSLGVVDEAIYAIEKDTTPDLIDAFYGREYDSVQTENSLTYYFSGEAGTRRMRLASLRPRSRLAQLKPEQLVKPKVRKYFPDTTFWAADIKTDAKGHAQASFAFPDSLTTWRATARGSSRDDRYGASITKTIVRKNLILRLAVPRFFVQGDEVLISAIVHNYLQTDKQARVDLKLEGLNVLNGAATQTVNVPQRGEAKVDWRVKAASIGTAKLSADALTNEESDALELTLPVEPSGVKMRSPRSGSISGSGSESFSVSYPTTAVVGSRSLSIRLAPSVAGSIFSALEYLTSFPYGCVEQTMSGFLPDIVVAKAMQDLKLKQPMDQAALSAKIDAGLQRLYGFHHEDGGWGWWATDDSHPFMTAYVVVGLAQAQTAGVNVDKDAITKGARWIVRYLAAHPETPPDLRGYMVYAQALSGNAGANTLTAVYGQRKDLSSYGLAILGLALEELHDGRASSVATELAKQVHESASEASWPASRDEMLDFSADVTPETTAYATKLISHEEPNSPLLPKAALWLVNHRDEGYWWSSTKQTAMVIYGLIDYVKASHELNPDIKTTVRVNGETVQSVSFSNDNLTGAPTVLLDEAKLQTGSNLIQIESTGKGRVYYSVSGDYYSNDPHEQNQGTIALNILRDYYRLAPTKSGDGIVYDLQPLSGTAAPGDVLAVRLTLTGSDWRYLMIEDPIPAGTEFVKDDSLYHLRAKPPWWEYWFSERENHDDRVAIFDRYFYRRQTEYFYLLKVVNPGVFHISPARVQPMYQPGNQATTGAAMLEAR